MRMRLSRPRTSARLLAASSALLAFVAACGGGDSVTNPPPVATVASVAVSPATASINVGASTTLAATPKDASGNAVSGKTVTWSSSNTSAATVSSSGVVTGTGAGSATITAAVGTVTGSATVTVTAPVASVTVSPASVTLYSFVADTMLKQAQLSVTLKDAAGNTLSGRAVTYTSSNPGLVTVSASGLVHTTPTDTLPSAVDTITVSSEGQTGRAIVTVIRPAVAQVKVTPASATIHVGGTQAVTVDLYDSQGHLLGSRAILYDQGNPTGIVTVSGGTITGTAQGTTTVSYGSEGVVGSTVITVTP